MENDAKTIIRSATMNKPFLLSKLRRYFKIRAIAIRVNKKRKENGGELGTAK